MRQGRSSAAAPALDSGVEPYPCSVISNVLNQEGAKSMTEEHPNVALLKRFDPGNVAGAADVLAEDVVWHFFNPLLPDVQGDYVGRAGLRTFFERMAKQTDSTFKVNPISVTAVGDELLVLQSKNTMIMEDRKIETDVVVVWRIVSGRIAEVWDIPSVHSARTSRA